MASRLSTSLCLAALLVHAVGLVAFSLAGVGWAKLTLPLRLAGGGLERLHFSKADFDKKTVGGHEFWHGGRLFDLESVEALPGDSVAVTGLADGLEAQAIHHLSRFFEKKDDRQAPGHALPNPFAQLLDDGFLPPEAVAPPLFFDLKKGGRPSFFLLKRGDGHGHLLSPPPDGTALPG